MYAMAEISADFDQLQRARRALDTAGAETHALGLEAPRGGDYGVAAPLVHALLWMGTDSAVQAAAEATVVGMAVGLAADSLGETDAQQAIDLVTVGAPL